MNLQTVEIEALKLSNKCTYLSYLTILQVMYETATEKKNYLKCSLIQDLIIEEVNS
jgi:hypothetical protein